ncbi:Rieske (2Fe-2S) protein [Paenibacillus sp. WQ 127069]|uniref:Rieske (2Fe-2S) protein n=1 Tax=Paenibacillus baimaensis TaxID=2982185 RepID=A0ABT2UAE6_9BACL|nr:Rieske (2Fe-2S) protein [Paenibacillus sp. WQ 127069]MCU6790887.1 Rieske (2Fe-2S) protein [Paenibacillus sp. WQ 127069]
MSRHAVCPVQELQVGERKIVTLEGRSIGVFNIKGQLYALKNSCPHQGAELCVGKIQGIMLPSDPGEYHYGRDGEIVRCPWHGWEFDITNGKSVFDPFKCLVKTYEVEIVDDPVEEIKGVETYAVDVESGWIVVTV